jgi:hypothetical protein
MGAVVIIRDGFFVFRWNKIKYRDGMTVEESGSFLRTAKALHLNRISSNWSI